MARTPGEITVTLSVLDRLIDHEPKVQTEAPLSRSQSVRILKAAVQRDLEWLLNTRRIADEPDESLKEINRSLYVYGLPDFSQHTVASLADQAKLIKQILTTIKVFEPRLGNVRVVPVETHETGIQQFHLRIEAMLLMDPAPEPVSFDTVIGLKSGHCKIAGGLNA
jgi:type VI secretion system protein ImpF